jgi:hypothetical protein
MRPFLRHDDGEVEALFWGSQGPSKVAISARDVKDARIYYATYTFDGDTLIVTEPTPDPLPPSEIAGPPTSASTIQYLDITAWGACEVIPPLKFAGPATGTLTISFRQRTAISGPIGNATGP